MSQNERKNLKASIKKILQLFCDYVEYSDRLGETQDAEAVSFYQTTKKQYLKDVQAIVEKLKKNERSDTEEVRAGRIVLSYVLQEIEKCLKGEYDKAEYTYFYLPFLKNGYVLLNEEYCPILRDVSKLDNMSALDRIMLHQRETQMDYEERLKALCAGEDDYGSIALLVQYFEQMDQQAALKDYNKKVNAENMKRAKAAIDDDVKNFNEELLLSLCYGQIDNTSIDEISQIVAVLVEETKEKTHNYGYLRKVMNWFTEQIKESAGKQEAQLKSQLKEYIAKSDGDKENAQDDERKTMIATVEEHIKAHNYAAAEACLNRMEMGDFSRSEESGVPYLREFTNSYEQAYKAAVEGKKTKRKALNKEQRAGDALLESWITDNRKAVKEKIAKLLEQLGFKNITVSENSKMKYCFDIKIALGSYEAGHQVAAFGSLAETEGFQVVCLFGRYNPEQMIQIFKDIGNSQKAIVLLDHEWKAAERWELARLTKKEAQIGTKAVIDKVVLYYLSMNYNMTFINKMLMGIIMPYAYYQPYVVRSGNPIPPEMFIGRKHELNDIKDPRGANIVYGGRQLGKSALLYKAADDINKENNQSCAVVVDIKACDYQEAAKKVSQELSIKKILDKNEVTDSWDDLAYSLKVRLNDADKPLPYFLLLLDEADAFIESCGKNNYRPLDILRDIQRNTDGKFKFVIAGLRDIVRFHRSKALAHNSGVVQLNHITVKPFNFAEAKELLVRPLSYLGFEFKNNKETDALITTILNHTNYFPGLIQLWCQNLIEAMKDDYAGYDEVNTPPYIVTDKHIRKVLKNIQDAIKDKFEITLKVDEDDYYYVIALLFAYESIVDKVDACTPTELLELAKDYGIAKLCNLEVEKVEALMEEMRELNILQSTSDGEKYRFARLAFKQMMGTKEEVEKNLEGYMEDV